MPVSTLCKAAARPYGPTVLERPRSLAPTPEVRQGEDPPRTRERVAGFDWGANPLGPRENWPPALRQAVDLCLRASVPTAVYWGDDLRLLYNDAFAPVLRERHPDALGRPAAEVWYDLWDLIRPQFDEAIASGEGVSVYEQMLPMRRGDLVEETYWNYSLTPIVGEDGAPVGILNQGIEITKALLAERRLSFQVKLADRLRRIGDPEEVKRAATEMLGEYLGAARVGYAEIDEAEGTVSVRSDWTRDAATASLGGQSGVIRSFGDEALAFLRTGEVLAVPDIRALPLRSIERTDAWEALGVRAVITVPLVREGALKALLYVHEPVPRYWRRSEAAIARDVAERTWAAVERAQAEQSLRASEDHYRHTVELNPQVTWTALPDGKLDRIAPRWGSGPEIREFAGAGSRASTPTTGSACSRRGAAASRPASATTSSTGSAAATAAAAGRAPAPSPAATTMATSCCGMDRRRTSTSASLPRSGSGC